MKRKHVYIIGGVVLLSLLGVGIASAFTVSSVDGVWGYIDGVTNTSNYFPVDGLGYAREGVRAPLRADQGYRLQDTVCTPMQNITPPWPNTDRWTSIGVTWGGFGSHTSTCINAPDLMFSEYVYNQVGWEGDDQLAIEIVNRTGSSVNLANYDLLLFTGDRAYDTISLSGTLNNNAVYVIVNNAAAGSVTGENLTISNNDDYRPIVLVYNNGGENTEGARNDRWATGPGNLPTVYSDWDPNVQNLSTTDENQVRYGRDAYNPSNWQSYSSEITDFAQQSGFGFDGRDGAITPTALTPFFLGEFIHYNNQVFSTNDNYQNANPFNYVDLTVTVPVLCNDGSTPTPPSFQIVPRINLEETSNSAGECEYGSVGDVPCPDRVTIEFPPTNPTFVCPDGTYTVNILGFTETGLGTDDCWESYNEDAVSAAYITQEDQNNYACLWARIEEPLADLSVAKTCWDFDTQNAYYRITTSNFGPGSARSVTLTDTLPNDVTYDKYTSQLITTSGTINQGTCSVSGQTVNCSLNTPLQDYSTDPLAKWVVTIYVNYASGDEIVNTVTVSSITADPVLSNNTDTAECDITFASLISFDAVNEDEGVMLRWETATELDNLGFNLFRAEELDGPKTSVNPVLIPSASPGSMAGSVYEYLDTEIEAGLTYYYWLEDVDFALTKTLFGPISVK